MITESRGQKKVTSHPLTWFSFIYRQARDFAHHRPLGASKSPLDSACARGRQVERLCVFAACGLWLTACVLQPAYAGDLDQTLAPSNDDTRMYTLEQIYDVSSGDTGTKPDKPSGGFGEPSSGPGSTMHTTDNIMDKLAAGVTTAAAGDVLTGKTVITRGSGTGETLTTGTMPDKEGDNASTGSSVDGTTLKLTAPTGFYDGDDTVTKQDDDFTAGNIKKDVNIFGVTGTLAGGSTGLPKTGQYQNYRAGDDQTHGNPAGAYDIGLPQGEGTWDNYWDARFTDNGDNTVTDNATGLMWIKDHVAMGTIGGVNWAGTMTWNNAIDNCLNLDYAGHTDWRLPNAYELFSICLLENGTIPYGGNPSGIKAAGAPYINQRSFPNCVSGFYWSSSTYPYNTTNALGVSFVFGFVYRTAKPDSYYVRAVRGGQ